jgi:hypothetical protein
MIQGLQNSTTNDRRLLYKLLELLHGQGQHNAVAEHIRGGISFALPSTSAIAIQGVPLKHRPIEVALCTHIRILRASSVSELLSFTAS